MHAGGNEVFCVSVYCHCVQDRLSIFLDLFLPENIVGVVQAALVPHSSLAPRVVRYVGSFIPFFLMAFISFRVVHVRYEPAGHIHRCSVTVVLATMQCRRLPLVRVPMHFYCISGVTIILLNYKINISHLIPAPSMFWTLL